MNAILKSFPIEGIQWNALLESFPKEDIHETQF